MVYKTIVPRLFSVTALDRGQACRYYNDGLRFILVLMAPLCLVCWMAAPDILTVLYGQKYLAAAPLLLVLGALIVLQALIHPTGQQLVANHRQDLRYKLQLIVAVVFIVANLFVIPRYGAWGAAIVSVACRLLLLAFFTVALWYDGFILRRSLDDRYIGVILGAGVVTAWAARQLPLPAWSGALLVLAVYGITAFGLRRKIGALMFLQQMEA
jgi:O-antigen/teichoic acid export membrane protein